MNKLTSILISALLVLAGCESMTVSECQVADWGRVGFNDAARGVSESRLTAYIEDCGKAGIQPNRQAYRQGWDVGIVRFCTAANGWREGVLGNSGKAAVCQGQANYDMFARYLDAGLQVHRTSERMRQNSAEAHRLQMRLDASTKDDEKQHLREILFGIEREQFHLRSLFGQQQLMAP